MITHIHGKLVEKNPTHLVIDCNGVGYFINISLHTFSQVPDKEYLRLYTYHHIREDAHSLYGFFQKFEREIFRLLISVSGIGTNIARMMLSSLAPKQVCDAILSDDVATIQSVKGIGAKTAQRVILDLRDKIIKIYDLDEVSVPLNNTNKDEALSALEVLGFARKQTEKVLNKIISETTGLTVEEMIKRALKNL